MNHEEVKRKGVMRKEQEGIGVQRERWEDEFQVGYELVEGWWLRPR